MIMALCGAIAHTYRAEPMASRDEIKIRETPLCLSGWSGVNSDESKYYLKKESQLCDLMVPRQEVTSVSHALHYLYFYGNNFTLNSPDGNSVLLLNALLHGQACERYCPSKPLFFRGADGFLRSSINGIDDGEAHIGQTLAFLGSAGVSSSQEIECFSEDVQIRDVVQSSLATFTATGEIEWLLASFLYYLPPERHWVNRWGNHYSFDACAKILVARRYGEGPCSGTHALAVLAMMLRVESEYDILSDDVEASVRDYLIGASDLLSHNQCNSGGWDHRWWIPDRSTYSLNTLTLHATGHHLEWILDAPQEVRPSQTVIQRSIQACRNALAKATPEDCDKNICHYTHAIKSVLYFESIESRKGDSEITP